MKLRKVKFVTLTLEVMGFIEILTFIVYHNPPYA